jgi:DNA-binding CsgD family transcriptional regulator
VLWFLLNGMRTEAFSGEAKPQTLFWQRRLSGMATRTRVNADHNSPAATAMASASAHIEELVRMILAKTAHSDNHQSSPNGSSEQILLDIHLDGERYLLVQMPKPSHIPLSPREIEIARMVAQGHSNKIIADVLSISSWTVCTHVRRIFAKLGVGSRAAMVARMLEWRVPGRSM